MGCSCTKGTSNGSGSSSNIGRCTSSDEKSKIIQTKSHNSSSMKTSSMNQKEDTTVLNDQHSLANNFLSRVSLKRRSNNSILKPFTNLFANNRTQTDETKEVLNDVEELNQSSTLSPPPPPQQSLPQPTILNESKQQQTTAQVAANIYSLSSLPIKTQHLLNSNYDFYNDIESSYQSLETLDDAQFAKFMRDYLNKSKTNREIQVYLSTPQMNSSTTSLISNRYNNYSPNNGQSNETLFSHLRSYCAQQINSYDLNLIDLNNNINNNNNNNLSSNGKYFRRLLGNCLLDDILGISSNNIVATCCFIFVIFLSDEAVETEDLLCPDRIELSDFKNTLHAKFNADELALFQRFYKQSSDPDSDYNLDYNCFLFNNEKSDLSSNDIDMLLDIFRTKLDDSMKLKYLKSVQQEEIERTIEHIDPASIVWYNLSNGNNSNTKNDFNFLRYKTVLDLLQSQVLAHNYKDAGDEKLMNDFLYSSIKLLIDNFMTESNKKQASHIALGIDKQLSIEIYKHYELFNYIRLNHYILNSKRTSLDKKQVQINFENLFNGYLRSNSSMHPLIISSQLEDDHNELSCTADELISKYIFDVMRMRDNKKPNIVYRFCGHTILSSDLTTLIQSVAHQICYLLEVHESWSFDNPMNLVDNLVKLLETRKLCSSSNDLLSSSSSIPSPSPSSTSISSSSSCANSKQLVIILDRLDRLIKTKYDADYLIYFLNKLFNKKNSTTTTTMCNLKLIISYSSSSSFNVKFSKTFAQVFGEERAQNTFKTLIATRKTSSSNNFKAIINFNEVITNVNFALKNFINNANTSNLSEALVFILARSRYGLKQSEIIDMLRLFSTHHLNIKSQSTQLDCILLNLWYTFKYYPNSLKKEHRSCNNLVETLIENNQVLFRLEFSGGGDCNDKVDFKTLLKNETRTTLNSLFASYFQSAVDKLTCMSLNTSAHSLCNSYFNIRAYEELPFTCLAAGDGIGGSDSKLSYLKLFVLSHKWIVNKSLACDNVLYYMHDLEAFKKHYQNDNQEEIINEEFALFECFFYNNIYALHQDPNQIYVHFNAYLTNNNNNNYLNQKTSSKDLLNACLVEMEKVNKTNNMPVLKPLNYVECLLLNDEKEKQREYISFNMRESELSFFSKVYFLNSDSVITLSAAHNQIQIWKIIFAENQVRIELSRSIKLNKSPRDIRLLDNQTAVVLVDRNLHLFDLKTCKHIMDMNSTMSVKVPFFEIHDKNHVVLLARNRLSVILMKVAVQKDEEESTAPVTEVKTTKTYTADDDLFLFKVGEDRYLNSLLVSKNGQVMVCGDEVQKPFPLLVWNLNKRKLVYDLRQAKHEFITSIQAISSTGRYVVSACQEEGESNNCLIVYDLSTGQLYKKLKAKNNFVAVEISEEVSVIIACLENAQIIIYDLNNGSKKFTLNSNRYPINRIKIFDTNKYFKNYFLTYDTKGFDWTIRLWDITKGDVLVNSFTCPARIVSCNINVGSVHTDTLNQSDEDLLIGVALFGFKKLLMLKLMHPTQQKKTFVSQELKSDKDESIIDAIHEEINL